MSDMANVTWELSDIQRDILNRKYRFGSEDFNQWVERVSGGNKVIAERIRKKQFLFGGRILAGRGLHKQGIRVTYSNCYVLTPPEDSVRGIWNTARDMAITYSVGGGVGISLRNLRPRGAKVHNAARTTTGAVSFMPLYSLTTELIGQEGRRGALMISIPSEHPDLEEFIDIKRDLTKVTKANISVEWSDEFMDAVVNRKKYKLRFEVRDTGEIVEKEIDAYKLFRRAAENNWLMAEPGCLFWNRISSWHFMSADPTFEFAGTNPCAEEPLPAGGSCLLGSINLSEFVVDPFRPTARFDIDDFLKCVGESIVALNEVLDEGLSLHPLEEQRKSVSELRQVGLGVMGIHEMLIKLGIVYGSQEALDLCSSIAHMMLNEAVKMSALISKEKGPFDRYSWSVISKSEFFKNNVRKDVKALVHKYGLRNSQLLCIAPTGSISTMLGVSGGIEPIFALGFYRTSESLHKERKTYWVDTPIVKEYMEFHGIKDRSEIENNPLFATAHKLNWRDRINMQAAWQQYIDASISSTVNLPESITVDEVLELYYYAWKMGLKGCTIYRDGCNRAGILTLDGKAEDKPIDEVEKSFIGGFFSNCPHDGTPMQFSEGCVICPTCGFNPCS